MMGFWHVNKGKIKISETNINKINTRCLRNFESLVSQETILFNTTIEENILVANRKATREAVVETCKKSAIHDFIIQLPKEYDTHVGALGNTLSGGERQRIGLARAFLHESPFLLLDEPTSNLDVLNEAIILKALNEERIGKTIAIVSHRMSSVSIADRIYDINEGKIS